MRVPQNDDHNNPAMPAGVVHDADVTYEQALVRATAAPFAVVPSAALVDRRLSALEFRILCAMCWHTNKRHLVWTSQETIAKELHTDQATISRAVAHLKALGYVEVVRRAYRGSQARRTNLYHVVWQHDDPQDAAQEVDDHICQQRIYDAPYMSPAHNHICRGDIQNSTIEQDQVNETPTVPSYPNSRVKQPSLAQRAPNAPAERQPGGAPAARGGELKNAMERDPLFQACREALGISPTTSAEWNEWRHSVNDFHRCHATPAQIRAVIAEYARRWPDGTMTLYAIRKHWSTLIGGEHRGTGLEISRAAGEARRRREQAERDNFDWRAERERWRRELADMGITLESVYGDAVDDPNLYRPRHITDG